MNSNQVPAQRYLFETRDIIRGKGAVITEVYIPTLNLYYNTYGGKLNVGKADGARDCSGGVHHVFESSFLEEAEHDPVKKRLIEKMCKDDIPDIKHEIEEICLPESFVITLSQYMEAMQRAQALMETLLPSAGEYLK
jgi:hypothetical protein